MNKSCYNCAYCRSTTGKNPKLYCSLKRRNFFKRVACKLHSFVFAEGFSIPSKFWKK